MHGERIDRDSSPCDSSLVDLLGRGPTAEENARAIVALLQSKGYVR